MISLTSQQARVFSFVRERIGVVGVAPSHEEIAAHLGVTSKSTVNRLLDGLEQRGRIRIIHGKARAIEIIDDPSVVRIKQDISIALGKYCAAHRVPRDVAVNELLRDVLGDAA